MADNRKGLEYQFHVCNSWLKQLIVFDGYFNETNINKIKDKIKSNKEES
jgi:hypothetical protein